MAFAPPIITDILIAPAPMKVAQASGFVSVGVVVDGNRVIWGDCLISAELTQSPPKLQHLVDLSTQALRGQRAENFQELCDRLRTHFPEAGESRLEDSARAALQQALLTAVANSRNRTEAQILAADYMIPNSDRMPFEVPLFLEISDFAATAERIDHMLALRPAGIGYRLIGERVAEAIGENAEYLQRFVRELGRRADSIYLDNDLQPAVYLGLNGAFGKLAGDPVRHVGKVLGNCVGLQDAAGGHRLILEEPFILEDSIAQSSNLHRLKDTLHRRWNAQKHGGSANLVGRGSFLSDDELALYSDTRSVHGLTFDFSAVVDLDTMMRRLAILHESGLDSYIALDSAATHRWTTTAADVAMAARSAGLILSFDDGDDRQYLACARHLAEIATRLRLAQ